MKDTQVTRSASFGNEKRHMPSWSEYLHQWKYIEHCSFNSGKQKIDFFFFYHMAFWSFYNCKGCIVSQAPSLWLLCSVFHCECDKIFLTTLAAILLVFPHYVMWFKYLQIYLLHYFTIAQILSNLLQTILLLENNQMIRCFGAKCTSTNECKEYKWDA